MRIVKISAMWCPACIIMNKYWKDIENEFSDIEFVNYDLDIDEEEIKQYNVGNILPVLVVSNNGIELGRLIGEKKYDEVVEFIGRMRDL